jgi:hypothetical protein
MFFFSSKKKRSSASEVALVDFYALSAIFIFGIFLFSTFQVYLGYHFRLDFIAAWKNPPLTHLYECNPFGVPLIIFGK